MSISGKYANYLRLNLTNESIHIEDTNSIIHKIILEKK